MLRPRFLDAPPERRLVRLSLLLVLVASLAIFLAGCGSLTGSSDPSLCPPWPEPGAEVADEIEVRMFPADVYPGFWDWMNRLDILREQLDSC